MLKGTSMPESRHRNWKPDAMPAFTMLSEALRTKNTTTATRPTVASTCHSTSRTLRSRRNVVISSPPLGGEAGEGVRTIFDAPSPSLSPYRGRGT